MRQCYRIMRELRLDQLMFNFSVKQIESDSSIFNKLKYYKLREIRVYAVINALI